MKIDAAKLAGNLNTQLMDDIIRSASSCKKCAEEKAGGYEWAGNDIHRSQINLMQDINSMAWGAIFMLIHLNDASPIENYEEVRNALGAVQQEYHTLRLNVIDRKINLFDLINSEE